VVRNVRLIAPDSPGAGFFSGSGNSPNVLKALRLARQRGAIMLGFTVLPRRQDERLARLRNHRAQQFHAAD
jgi:fructoselysine-6-P-deglycase FrlB-like protein